MDPISELLQYHGIISILAIELHRLGNLQILNMEAFSKIATMQRHFPTMHQVYEQQVEESRRQYAIVLHDLQAHTEQYLRMYEHYIKS
jgi:Mg2+ and Co2+ transporter CorA